MDISKIIPVEKFVEILHPATEEKLGVKVSLVSVNSEKVKTVKRAVANANLKRQMNNKNIKIDEFEENVTSLLVACITSWDWYGDTTFNGKKPELNEKNIKEVFAALPWFKEQLVNAINDEKSFFQD